MQVIKVTKRNIKDFINMTDVLYKGDEKYVPYMRYDLKKTLTKLIEKDKSYTALLAVDNDKILARVLFTIDKDKHLNTEKCGFFCMYECIDDIKVSNAILSEMKSILIQQGVEYISGTYYPYDQDNRRGILVKGFEDSPMVFTSYNKPYYDQQLKEFGFVKESDTYEYLMQMDEEKVSRLTRLSNYAKRHSSIRVDSLNYKNIEQDISDVHKIMLAATNEIVYQEAPSEDVLRKTFSELKGYLNKDFILIARNNDTNEPVGFVMAIPDFFQVFKKMDGKINPRTLLIMKRESKRITSARAMLQYVIPEYQKSGAIAMLYCQLFENLKNHNISKVEAGTIMENNTASRSVIEAMGGIPAKTYRLYQMKV